MRLKILVAGGYDLATDNSGLRAFCQALGAGIAERGHTLVNMCLTEMDKIVAEAAFERMKQLGVAEPDEHFRTYVLAGRKPIHNCGVLLRSRLSNLQIDKPELYRPETIDASDVVILAGGFAGTLMVANWARLANKPVLPLTCFGGAAEQVFQREIRNAQDSDGARLAGQDYYLLNQISTDWNRLSADVLQLAEKIAALQRRVFLVHGHDEDAILVTSRLLESLGLPVTILRDEPNAGRTVIKKLIDFSDVAFAIILLTGDDRGGPISIPYERQKLRARQNVILELGFFLAKLGSGRVCALCAKDVEIPSDYEGVLFVPLDNTGKWRKAVADELAAAGLVTATATRI